MTSERTNTQDAGDDELTLQDEPSRAVRSFDGAMLNDSSFAGESLVGASFAHSKLKRCNFADCDLSHADFSNADLYRASFRGATLYSCSFKGADLTRADFTGARLYGVKIFDADVTRITIDTVVPEETEATSPEEFSKASDVYITLKRALREHGDVSRAAEYYYRQRVCQRRMLTSRLARATNFIALDLLVGYGEKPSRAIGWSIATIITSAVLYIAFPSLSLGRAVDKTSSPPATLSGWSDLLNALQLSASSFVGADLGSWDLSGWARTLMTLEATLGTTLLAIIIVGFSRKIVRD